MIIAQITDTHIKRKGKLLHHMVNTARCLRQAVDRLNRLGPRPDVVLATGDLTDEGKPKEYKRLRKILEPLEIPLYLIPGNHDRRDALREAFPDHRYLPRNGPYLQYAIEHLPLRLIGLDTLAPGEPGGALDIERLRWLEITLHDAHSRPTVIFMHHPPFATGIRHMDAHGFRGLDEFAAIVRRSPQIARIICGHIHRPMEVAWEGTVASTAPSTAHQIVLELRDRQPLGFVLEPPGFALHVWDESSGMRSRTLPVERLGDLYALPFTDVTSAAQ